MTTSEDIPPRHKAARDLLALVRKVNKWLGAYVLTTHVSNVCSFNVHFNGVTGGTARGKVTADIQTWASYSEIKHTN